MRVEPFQVRSDPRNAGRCCRLEEGSMFLPRQSGDLESLQLGSVCNVNLTENFKQGHTVYTALLTLHVCLLPSTSLSVNSLKNNASTRFGTKQITLHVNQ